MENVSQVNFLGEKLSPGICMMMMMMMMIIIIIIIIISWLISVHKRKLGKTKVQRGKITNLASERTSANPTTFFSW